MMVPFPVSPTGTPRKRRDTKSTPSGDEQMMEGEAASTAEAVPTRLQTHPLPLPPAQLAPAQPKKKEEEEKLDMRAMMESLADMIGVRVKEEMTAGNKEMKEALAKTSDVATAALAEARSANSKAEEASNEARNATRATERNSESIASLTTRIDAISQGMRDWEACSRPASSLTRELVDRRSQTRRSYAARDQGDTEGQPEG